VEVPLVGSGHGTRYRAAKGAKTDVATALSAMAIPANKPAVAFTS